jgi:dihydroorotate dehydrogenase (fumarate)
MSKNAAIVIAAPPDRGSGQAIERRTLDMVRTVVAAVNVPVAVKLSPSYTSLVHFVRQLDEAGAHGMVLFNRFYQPDINVEELEIERTLHLSDSSELPLRLNWLAILSGQVRASLAVSGGVHTAVDAVKAVMAGAHAIQFVSALLRSGPEYIRTIRREMVEWMERQGYESLRQMHGNMNRLRCPDPSAFERSNYIRILHSWHSWRGDP